VTFEGKHFKFDEAIPLPKPFQKPYPPIWAAVHSADSFEWAARKGYHAAKNLDTDDVVEQRFNAYRRVWQENGHPGTSGRIFLMRTVHVAQTDEQAEEEARQYLGLGGEGRVGGGPIANTRIGWGTNARGMGRDSELAHNAERGFCGSHSIGAMPAELVDRSIELFGREVIPAFTPVGVR
jgi:alkanesulfonate monooxygenase SsuD/methylene tetrahydromethanopterin reductase-like flavin-dependent oxidoreductase (luciferase family)